MVLVLAFWAHAASAQAGLEGRFAATAIGNVEPGASLRIELLDDNDLNLRLLPEFEQALADLGYALSDEGEYEITFATEEINDLVAYERPGIFSFQLDTRRGVDPSTGRQRLIQSRTTLWSSTEDSLFARRKSSGPGDPLLRMEVEVRSLNDKRQVVWVARAETLTRRSDPYQLYQQMIPVVTESIGQTVPEETIILR